MGHSGTLKSTNALTTADPLAGVRPHHPPPSCSKHKAEKHYTSWAVSHHRCISQSRGKSATSANNEVTKTGRKNELKGRERIVEEFVMCCTEGELWHVHGSLHTHTYTQ